MTGTLIELNNTDLDNSHTLSKDNYEIVGDNIDQKNEQFKNLLKELDPKNGFENYSKWFRNSTFPIEFLKENTYQREANYAVMLVENSIKIGRYPDHGVILPRDFGNILFDELYQCTPLISLIKGDEEYISFLHVWGTLQHEFFDEQVENWMKTIAGKGDVVETIFAPRKNSFRGGSDTNYQKAPEYLKEHSKTTIVLNRNISPLEGIANKEGVFFKDCGYHLWNS
ncbi:hypothetical protein ACFLTH_04245 [Bacteroidota bacterium]